MTGQDNNNNPQAPGNSGMIPSYHPQNIALQTKVIKQAWLVAKKHYEEYQKMNKALTERFMSLLPTKYQLGYNKILTRDPNRIFEDTLNCF